MDNITHTLIGVLVGETLACGTAASRSALPRDTRRSLLVGTMAVGSNVPDLDFLYSAFTGSKLDYLLQHRGYTHTAVGAVLIGLLLFLLCRAWLGYRKFKPARIDNVHLAATALLAPRCRRASRSGWRSRRCLLSPGVSRENRSPH